MFRRSVWICSTVDQSDGSSKIYIGQSVLFLTLCCQSDGRQGLQVVGSPNTDVIQDNLNFLSLRIGYPSEVDQTFHWFVGRLGQYFRQLMKSFHVLCFTRCLTRSMSSIENCTWRGNDGCRKYCPKMFRQMAKMNVPGSVGSQSFATGKFKLFWDDVMALFCSMGCWMPFTPM
jgi:hypothetical protein